MTNLVLLGISHKTAPLEVRERFAISEERLIPALNSLRKECGLPEGLIVSTCNRVELIASDQGNGTGERLAGFLHQHRSVTPGKLDQYFYQYRQQDLVRHVFRVACSLDSMVPGESQILGQLKQAFAAAQEAGTVGTELNRLIPRAFFVAKRVRRETNIGESPVSVSSIAVELATKIFGELSRRTVLLLGAGKMGELAALALIDSGASRLLLANRTRERATHLADQMGGTAVPFQELNKYLVQADIVLVSTGADSFTVQTAEVEKAIQTRRNDPIFFIDISVPRNVDPAINELSNAFLYDLDDLQTVAEENLGERLKEAERAEEIIHLEVQKFLRMQQHPDLGSLISTLRSRLEEICLQDLRERHPNMESEDYQQQEKLLRQAARRIAHPLIQEIKDSEQDSDSIFESLKILRRAFQLDRHKEE